MVKELLIRFVVGGMFVSAFAILGDVLEPKRFAGLFGSAPSVELATLGLTVGAQGKDYAASEARSMIAGAIGLLVYALCVYIAIIRYKSSALRTTMGLLPLWLGVSFALWAVWLR